MNIGMLWLDDDKGVGFDDKVVRAARYYKDKYGRSPNLCLVHKGMLAEEKRVGKIQVRPAQNVLPNHFWLGIFDTHSPMTKEL
jgi:hypothetical protein